ncbi:threonine-phosphate decarboxylase CobD [Candidatus Nitrosotalea sp. TS]|uniref:threonine-phosphate decarboxylase CobD n=1 Tax=Candidatus Nitrosotalea sp. TS TaxID=2341020 RepID=UPI001407C811|nr:threonine-phosphate decarboxylase CobD [Candidatus Nitrosotalea sp. TS]
MRLRVEPHVANHKTVAHGGVYSAGLEFDPKILDFSSNVNPLGFPSTIKNDLKKNSNLFSVYPDSDSTRLRTHLENYTGIPKNQIIIGNGATEIIYNFSKAFLNKRNVSIPIPTFGEYESAARLNGARVSYFKTMNLNQDIDNFLKIIPKNHCIFVCNPNNPTGILTSQKNMLKILDLSHDKSVLVFVDECFIELASNPKESIASKLHEFDNLFILRSMTKSFGLAGLRVGYGLGSKKMIEILNKIKIPWNVSGIAQNIAIRALSDRSHLKKTRKLIEKERNFLDSSISKIDGFSCYGSDANFILIKSKISSKQLQKKLLKKNILIRDCSSFRGLDSKFIRVAVRTHDENQRLVKEFGKP